MTVKASIVVQFGSSSSASLIAELDSEMNNDRTSFIAGDSVYFKVYSDISYSVHTSGGTISLVDTAATATEEESISFALEDSVNVSKPIKTLGAVSWYGSSPGTVTKIGTNAIKIPKMDKPYIGKISYTTEFNRHKLTPPVIPSGEEYLILIVVEGS